MNRRLLVTGLALVLLTSCGGRDGTTREAADAPAALPALQESASMSVRWRRDVGNFEAGHIHLTPVVSDRVVFAASPGGRVLALATETGETIWTTDLDRPLTGGVGLGDGLVLVVTENGELVALDTRSGRKLWERGLAMEVLSAPAAADGVVVVQSTDGRIVGLSSTAGEVQWQVEREMPSLTLLGGPGPVVHEGVMVAGLATGKIVAVELATGQVLWEISIAQSSGRNEIERLVDIDAKPLLVGSVLYVAAYQSRITALALGTRRILWTRDVSSHRDLAADNDRLYVADEAGRVTAYDRLTGDVTWTQSGLLNRGVSAPAVAGAVLAVGDGFGYVHLLDRESGQFVGRRRLGRGAVEVASILGTPRLRALSANGELAMMDVVRQ